MQTYTQLPGKKSGLLRVVVMMVLLSASLPLVTACNPFSKSTTSTPACQTNNTADVRFYGGSLTASTHNVVWDGVQVATVTPGQYTSYTAQAAGYHTLVFKFLNGTNACTSAVLNLAQCSSHTYYCQG